MAILKNSSAARAHVIRALNFVRDPADRERLKKASYLAALGIAPPVLVYVSAEEGPVTSGEVEDSTACAIAAAEHLLDHRGSVLFAFDDPARGSAAAELVRKLVLSAFGSAPHSAIIHTTPRGRI